MASSTTLKFSLKVGSLPANKFRVQEFTLNEAVSECFYLHVQASSEDANIAYAAMIGQAATLKVEGEDFPVTHHGVVTEFNQYPDHSESHGHESYLYDMIIEPRLKLLSYTSQNRIFLKQDAKDIVTKVLTDAGLGGTNIEFQVSGAPPKREYTVQYNETDLNFVQRLLEDEGIFYFFDHEGDKEKLIMADKVGAIRPVTHTPEVVYHPEAGLAHLATDHIMKVKRTQKMVTGKVTIKDYNSNTPEATVKGGAAKNGQGELYAFGPHVRTAADANRMATLRAEMLACGKTVLEGEGICRAFRPGFRFKLKEEAASHFGGDYLLTRVTHHGDQREGFEGDQAKLIFTNAFTCIPADTVFRPPLHTPKPRIHGVITARVTGNDTKYANVDEEGRYHAKLPFDLTDAKNDQASVPVRMAQPYGGPNYGVHFPLHNDNDMVLAFFDGDVDRPIGMGTVPNPSTSSPVNDRNKSESVIRTASGHQIRLDDKEDKTVIDITTHGKHVLSMNDDKDKQEIHFKTTDENEMVFDDKNKNIRIMTPKGAHLIKLDYDKKVLTAETKYGHKLTMDDEAKKIALQTKDGHILALDDDKKLITLQDGKGKHVFQIDVGGSVISITTTGDMEIAAKGKLNIEAKEITMEAKQGAFNVKAMKDIAMEGMNFNAKGKMKLALEGTTEASMKGLQTKIEGTATLDLKSTGQAKLSGLKASLEGQVMSEVKAAIVMIN